MAAGTVSTADAREEGFRAELAGRTYRIMRALARGPQDERFLVTRLYGIGFPEQPAEELRREMGMTPEAFESLRKRAVKRLREAERG